jgi:sulfate transport system ATP-binding protein
MSIDVTAVSKRFGDFVALDNITLHAPSRRLTALLGPSGGGKSTLLRIIAGLERATSGSVAIEGVDATDLPARKRDVGFVFQHYAAFKHLTVAKNIAFGLEIRHRPKDEIRQRVDDLLALVHLKQFAHRLPSQLSGGQRQRMVLARALAVEPKVLLLDEPFGALDAKVRQELRQWLRQLHEEVPVTTVFVTHDQEEALQVADEIVVINQGRLEQTGTPEQLWDAPANPFVMGFLGEVTTLAGQLVRPRDILVHLQPQPHAAPGQIVRRQRVGYELRLAVRPQADGAAVAGAANGAETVGAADGGEAVGGVEGVGNVGGAEAVGGVGGVEGSGARSAAGGAGAGDITVILRHSGALALALEPGRQVWLQPAPGALTVPAQSAPASL